jgi:hypothetical protein
MRRIALLVLTLAILPACTGGSSSVPSSSAGFPTSSSSSLMAGTQPSTTTFSGVSAGPGGVSITGSLTLPATTSGSGSMAAFLSAVLPSSTPALSSVTRRPAAIGAAGIAAVAYVTLVSSSSLSFSSTPAFTFTLSRAPCSGCSEYVAFYDPTNVSAGWTTLAQATVSGSTVSFAGIQQSTTYTAGQSYVYALFTISASTTVTQSVIPCSNVQDLRSLGTSLAQVTNSSTHDTMEYTIIGDGALSSDVLVMFPGTGQIMTGWPVQLLTNATYSPLITKSVTYDPLEDGSVSLCHDYRIVLFDYPGVGLTSINGSVTRDMIASDVDAMLNDATKRFGISTNVVDPVGWSEGTGNALKYAVLSPVARPSRTIHNVILIAAHGGGSLQAQVGPDSASCVTTMFGASLTATGSLKNQLDALLTEMIFPFVGQTATNSGTNSGCTATVTSTTVTLSITPDCEILNHCLGFIASSIVDMKTYPWSLTNGIDTAVYTNERQSSNDYDVAYCSGVGSNFTSTGCTSYGTIQMSTQNGGVCKTDTSNTNVPVSSSCDSLTISGRMVVINGFEDLLTQWTYGKALVDAYVRQGAGSDSLQTYPGSAGHGVMIQHPLWTQTQMFTAMQ